MMQQDDQEIEIDLREIAGLLLTCVVTETCKIRVLSGFSIPIIPEFIISS